MLEMSRPAGRRASRLGVELRCALTISSVGSKSLRIGLRLLLALVNAGHWTRDQALATARQNPDAEARAAALGALADGLSEPERTSALREALGAATAIGNEMERAWALRALAPRLTREALPDALELGRSIMVQLHDERRPQSVALAALLARKAELDEAEEALEEAIAFDAEPDRARALAALAPQLPDELVATVLANARDMLWDANRALVLAALARLGPEPTETGVLREALDAAAASPPDDRASALRQLAPYLPRKCVGEVLHIARHDLAKGNQWLLMTALAARLADLGEWGAAINVAREIGSANWRVRALAVVVGAVPDGECAQVRNELLEAGRRTYRSMSLVAPHLPEPLVREELERSAPDSGTVSALLARLAELGSAEEALERARAKRDAGDAAAFAECLPALIAHLPESLRPEACREALRAAQAIDDAAARQKTLARLARPLRNDPVGDLLRELRSAGEGARAAILGRRVPALPENLLSEALAAADALPTGLSFGGGYIVGARVDVLLALAPWLPPALRAEALQRARAAIDDIPDTVQRVSASNRLAAVVSDPRVPDDPLRDATERAREVRAHDEETAKQVRALLAEAEAGADGDKRDYRLREALRQAQTIKTSAVRAEVLAGLAPHLAELVRPPRDEAEGEFVSAIQAVVLTALAPALGPDELPTALEIALAIRDERKRHRVIEALAPRMAELAPAALLPLWGRILHRIALARRASVLDDLEALVPVVEVLGGREAVVSMAESIKSVGSWWP
jgi:hypothetical protein